MTSAARRRRRPPRLIRPVKAARTEQPALAGAWAAEDDRLDRPDLYPLPGGAGPEDVLVDASGALVTGAVDGRIWRWPAGARPVDRPELVADTGGRPLGIELDPRDGSLLVCDAWRGLLRVTGDGQVHELTDHAAGTPILFCNNAAVQRDGTVLFTDSSDRYPITAWRQDLLEYRPNGRLLAYHPDSGRTEVVARNLYFPNGVALTSDESAVLVVETSTHRLVRVSLRSGDVEVVTEFAAYPDNLASAADGTYWVALPSLLPPVVGKLLPHPWLRRVAALLPTWVPPKPARYSIVAQLDADGQVLRTLHGPAGRYTMITGVRADGDTLWLGSLTEHAVARVRL